MVTQGSPAYRDQKAEMKKPVLCPRLSLGKEVEPEDKKGKGKGD